MQKADDDAAAAEDEEDSNEMLQINRYKLYLQRFKKSYMIAERKEQISEKLGATLQGLSHEGPVEIFHTATSDYMTWIKSEKIAYERQPALSPEDTGVPTIRRYLYNLPASQNLRDYTHHIDIMVPAFIEKMKRVVTQSDRDVGFRTIANELDDLRARLLGDLVKTMKYSCATYAKGSIGKIEQDRNAYKEAVSMRIEKRWLSLKSAAFTRILKSRGTVPQGTSKAKGLENTVNWNLELASILKPGFQKWYASHSAALAKLKAALPPALDTIYHKMVALMNDSAANLMTVEKSKMKFLPLRHKMRSKIVGLMEEMIAEEKKLLHRATLEDERENNIISAITDEIYDDVFASFPEIKSTVKGKKRYWMPILRFRKSQLEARFLKEESHFVDKVMSSFMKQLEDRMSGLIDKHFEKLNAMFDDFSKLLRDHAPVDFDINPLGEQVREELEKHIPYLEDKAEALRSLLPLALKEEDDTAAGPEDVEGTGDQVQDLNYFLDKVSKAKRKSGDASKMMVKRVKLEDDWSGC